MSASAARAVLIGGADARITLADLLAVARFGAEVVLDPSVAPRLEAARAVVDREAVRNDVAIYGLTTGLGAAVDTRLSGDDLGAFQSRAIEARAVAVGDRLTIQEVRATLFCRLAGLAQGASGISPGFLDAIARMLNAGLHPRARRIGSLGEADLAPLAELALLFAGGGEAVVDGRVLPGPEALARAGIVPPPLGPKDGIAIINANAFGTALAAFATDAMRLGLDALLAAGALACEGFRANLSVLDPRLLALRSGAGIEPTAARLRALLAGGDLAEPGHARRVQDPLSFRCLAPVHAVAIRRLDEATEMVEAELNGAGDSPAVLAEDGEILSTVNFDTSGLALALEGLGQVASHAAALSAFRTVKLMSPALSGLSRFLTPLGGSRTGFATAQKSAAALEAEIRHLALPLGPMALPVADGVEDYAPMTPRIAERMSGIAARLTRLAAIELTVAAAAIDLRDGIRLGAGTERAYRFVRERVAPLAEDRPTGGEFEALAVAIEARELEQAMEGVE